MFEGGEIVACLIDDIAWHAGQPSDVQPITLARGPGFDAVKKYQLVAVLAGIEVDVPGRGQLVGQARELEIMRSEEREGARPAGDETRRGPG